MATALPGRPGARGCPVHVLLIEDCPTDVELSVRELRKAWFDVHGDVVDNPDDLLARLRTTSYDIILADYRLPGWTGMDALEIVQKEGKDIPVVLVTGSLGEEPAVECLKRGVTDYVLKDRLARLPVAVRRALDEKNLREAQRRAEEALRRSEARQRLLIQNATFGIGRTRPVEDRFLEANPALVEMLGYASDRELLELRLSRDLYADPNARALLENAGDAVRDVELDWKRKDGATIRVRVSGRTVRDTRGDSVECEYFVEDITEQTRAAQRVAQLNRLYAILCHINEAIVRIRGRDELFREACRIAVEEGLFRMAWVGMLQPGTGVLKPVAWHGHEDGFLESIRISTADVPEGRGPVGLAVQGDRPFVCHDIRRDPRMLPWRDEALRRGYQASAAFPIRAGGVVAGVFMLCAGELGGFDQENVKVLEEMAADLSFAIEGMAADDERRRFERELDQFFTLSQDMLGIAGLDGFLRRFNPAWTRVIGYTAEELRSAPLFHLVHPEDRPAASRAIEKLTHGENVASVELRFRAKDGSYRWLLVNSTPAPEPGLVYAAARDITDRKASEEAQARLAAIVESSDDAIVGVSPEGLVTSWNPGAERLFGYTAQEMVGRPLAMLAPPEWQPDTAQTLARVRRGESVRNHEVMRVTRDGRLIDVSVTLSPIRADSGEVVGLSGIASDITERRQLEDQLRAKNRELQAQNRQVQEANRMKSEFLANMSHELRSPLNGIIGFAELMYDGKLGPVSEAHREYLGDILSSAKHLLRLINDVLDLAKVESGRIEFRPEPVSLERLIREARDVLRAVAVERRTSIDVSVSEAVGEIVLDPFRFKQVLYNYLSNALKFTPEEGRVSVRVLPEGEREFRLEVEDNGIGIPPEELRNLFVEFRQLDTGAAKRYQGSGLGLALTKRIVEAQGGHVGVCSRPGQGSVFSAVLPRVPIAPMPPGRSVPVLIVEDDEAERCAYVQAMRQAGYAVELAGSGAEALAKCGETRFAAITLDLLLPDESGWEVLRQIRGSGPNVHTPVVVVSMVAEAGAGAVFPIQGFLTKPVEGADLLAALSGAGVPAPEPVT